MSKNHRYLVDRRGRPFLLVGDSPQSLVGNLSLHEAARFIADRRAAGFNTLLIDVLCASYTGCRPNGTTYDGIQPFERSGDLSTPDPAYFDRVAAVVRLASKAGMAVFLDPIETGGWLPVLRVNGPAVDRAYGRFLGRRFGKFENVVWISGNDFQTWRNPADDAVVLAVARGIRSTDRTALQTTELDYLTSSSHDDPRWSSLLDLDAAYTYSPTYAEVLAAYDHEPVAPVFLAEAGYEFEQNMPSLSEGVPAILRRQEYWTMLSGATGQFYGNHFTWQFADGWSSHLDTVGSRELGYLAKLFGGLRWWTLVPDQAHRVVTEGYGTFARTGNVGSSDYVTTAAARDGSLSVSYLPEGGRVVVDTLRFRGPVQASWFDPTNGTYRSVPGSPFLRGGRTAFTAPTVNHGGGKDWVLVLESPTRR